MGQAAVVASRAAVGKECERAAPGQGPLPVVTPIMRSMTLVPVGPVTKRSPVLRKSDQESFRRRKSAGSSPSLRARGQLSPSAKAPAASVGPSLPSVPAASRAAPAVPSSSRPATRANSWLRPPRPSPRRVRVSSPPASSAGRNGLLRQLHQPGGEGPGGLVNLAVEVAPEHLGAVAEAARVADRGVQRQRIGGKNPVRDREFRRIGSLGEQPCRAFLEAAAHRRRDLLPPGGIAGAP